ncbi:hypothetical protein C3V39_08940 [Prevotella sp. oral taxon 820]|nr:hypothetical protein C3V39_08940 [Prevotella sp. oral taxon 820]
MRRMAKRRHFIMQDYSDNTILIAGIRDGKHEAYGYLFATYYPRLHNYAMRFLADSDSADDFERLYLN